LQKVPLFSIIIPTYNRSSLLRRAIQHVVDQEVSNWELLVIDDGSTDDTQAVVAAFQEERIQYFQQKNQGQSAARNQGVLLAKGQYILFLGKSKLINLHLKHPTSTLSYTTTLYNMQLIICVAYGRFAYQGFV